MLSEIGHRLSKQSKAKPEPFTTEYISVSRGLTHRICCEQAVKKDSRGLPETFSKRMLFDYRWLFIMALVVLQGFVWCCSCCLGCFKCACGFGAEMLWATVKGLFQSYYFNMDPGRFCCLTVENLYSCTAADTTYMTMK